MLRESYLVQGNCREELGKKNYILLSGTKDLSNQQALSYEKKQLY